MHAKCFVLVVVLVVAQKQTTTREILLWMTPSEAPKALQASECSELLDPTGANCWIFAKHWPGKFESGTGDFNGPIINNIALVLSFVTLHAECQETEMWWGWGVYNIIST